MKDVGIFYGHLVYIRAIWYSFVAISYNLWSFGIFFRFGMVYREKSGNPAQVLNCIVNIIGVPY
jgi:hypothetical protein